ncbi:MAG: hypothetical protein HIU82_02260 [Proteobacteria bacterium]|nr:hypothetical protein [Pseudomonadota bacterium]
MLGHLLRRTAWRRDPDFVIGTADDPYLRRWWLIPRNPLFNLYVHHFLRSDDDRALHDHPWPSLSVILDGRYIEHVAGAPAFLRDTGQVTARGPRAAHRVELLTRNRRPQPVRTLFITGPRVRAWGFHCPNGWRRWQDFVADTPGGNTVGRGCE